MDKIEASVLMPAEAQGLDHYARYYGRDRDGSVRGVFTYPFAANSSDAQCEELGKGIIPCEEPKLPYPMLEAGERMWLKRGEDLPGISDGRCSVIEFTIPPEVVARPDQRWRIKLQCNGR
ncbi:hypothetical protein BFL28_06885 [Sphingomonas turrisvirgatae]|uniref:Uncharacterized protein n=2 Tax=Sphingomonas turrisvirgatae TaxID=1888892 RepID=A0A1E3LTI2_9SPHN|nr:hypothetical protein BFL28_06885 [Sphingomonas turrisvirgatae]